jgi:hypothetical protein
LALGLGRASPALPALALALDLAGDRAEEARRRCGDGDGLSRGAAAAAPAATMALRSRGISPWFWGFGGFRFKMDGGSGADAGCTAAEVEWEPSETWGEGKGMADGVRSIPSQGQKGESKRNKGPVPSAGGPVGRQQVSLTPAR